jgi:hypothetical protein
MTTMNFKLRTCFALNKRFCWLAALLALSVTPTQAATQEIRALFQPDPAQPNKNVFINKTPNSGYCANYPGECAENGMFSIQLPIRFDSIRPLNPSDVVAIQVPGNWRQLIVSNPETQQTETMEVRISGVGSEFHLSDPATKLTGESDLLKAHQQLWINNSWVYAPLPCLYSGVGAYGPSSYRFFWKTPMAAYCTKSAAYYIPSMYFDTLDIAYELRTPNPLGMSTGIYTGSITYSVINRGDFDFGPLMQSSDGSITLDFVLDVQHTLKVDIPPGGNRVSLEPQGGWQGWLESGRRPTRLYRDQTFLIWASSKFSMKIECEHDLGFGDGCGIMDRETGFAGLVNVSVSLPNGLNDSSGQPVRKMPLGRTPTAPFQPGIYVDRKPGTLHFEVAEQYTDWLIDHRGDKPYKGNITVIWDSEVG